MSVLARLMILAIVVVTAACTGSDGGTASPDTSTPESPTTTEDIPPETLPIIDDAPGAPANVIVVNTSDGSIELAWDRARTDDVTGYEITRVSPAGRTETFEVGGPSFVDSGLDDGDLFTYQVVALGPGGRSDRSEAVTAQVGVDNNPPTPPGRPQVVADSDASIELEWSPSSDISGVENYVITRIVGDETTEIEVAEPTWTDDVDAGVVVTYAVRAVDSAGNSSETSRAITVLSGNASDTVIIVVSAVADPATDTQTARLSTALLDAGFAVTWFEDDVFDANVTRSEDTVLLLGDIEGERFDWNIFATDSTIIGLKSLFVQAANITENPPKLDRLAQVDYTAPGGESREVILTNTGRPKPAAYIPVIEQVPDLEIWARPVWSDEIAVAGLIREGDNLANDKPAKGCRAFFPGNAGSLAEQTDDAWDLLVEFVGEISETCR